MFLKKNKGFTLVELLLSVFILAGAIGGALLLFVSSMVSSQLAWDMTVATSHAEYVLEEAQMHDSLADIIAFNWKGWADGQGLNTLPDETIDVTFTSSSANLLGIQATVSWTRKSREHDVMLKTKIAR